ncbi:WD40 repeat protein [Nonomuraea thailandensis]|uniref:WD40 repeat protein n=1 Tax=Nonomuraea thailandensis TaxID=1188745 RepID=A0A9X2K092_9ACTN|nr:FG-GAP-like repeat-containing protein [Nonomuraea thailandensis]MCP2356092.1 WD40 repeat protein [Nonomuraea thailandensis]
MRWMKLGICAALMAMSTAVAVAEPAAAQAGGLSPYDRLVLSHEPAAYWRLSHPSAGTELDRAGNGHKGTFRGVTSSVQLPNRDGAAVFDGTSGYFEVPDARAFHISTTGKFTVEAWIRPHALNFPDVEQDGYVYFMGKGTKSGAGGDQEWAGRMYNKSHPDRPNRISGYAWNPEGGFGAGAAFQHALTVNQWIHVAITFDTSEGTYGKVRIYRNGVLSGSDNLVYRPGQEDEVIVKPRPGPAPVRVGTRNFRSYFQGAIGKFAMYDRALTAAELRSHYAVMTGANQDFNSDGVGDLFSAATGTLTVWNGTGANGFAAATPVGPGWDAYSRPIAGDFNRDGLTDLAASRKDDHTLHVWNGKGADDFTAAQQLGAGWAPYEDTLTSLGDINQDGNDDIAATYHGTLYVWNGRGGNAFGPRTAIGANWGVYTRPIGGDFNGDGIGDLAAVRKADHILFVWNGRGANNFTAGQEIGPGWEPYASTLMTPGDINQNGINDLAATHDGKLYIWNGKGANTFGLAQSRGSGWAGYF